MKPLVTYYVGGTPFFFLLDAVWGASIRASFLQHPWARYGYYLFCIVCGVVCWLYPRRAVLVGIGESALNITLLILGFMIPILSITEAVVADPYAPVTTPVTIQGVINFAIAGGMGWWSFQRRVIALRGSGPAPGPGS